MCRSWPILMTQVFQMTASLKNLPNPGNTEGGFLNLCPTAVLQPLLQWLCEWCLTSPKWPDWAVHTLPAVTAALQNLSPLPSNKDKGSFLSQRGKEGILQVARNLVTVLQSWGSDRNRAFTAGIREKILLWEYDLNVSWLLMPSVSLSKQCWQSK